MVSNKTKQKVWLEAWLSVAGSNSCLESGIATKYADKCLEEYLNRFDNEEKGLFDEIPIGIPLILILNDPYKAIEVTVEKKVKHSQYSYSLFCISLDKKYGGYYWIKPKWMSNSTKRVIGFITIKKESNDN